MHRSARPPIPTSEEERNQTSLIGLRYSSDLEPGFRRRRHGKHFRYFDQHGKPIRDAEVLQRIARLAIPPAYTDVWICPSERGHLQATGRDARGRKQYRYHARWRTLRDRDKFARVVEFADRLPALRRRLRRDLAQPGLGRDKVLAMAVSIMAQTLIRVGNAEYEASNHSYGLTTLRNRHISFARGHALFRFHGKGGLLHEVEFSDVRLIRLLRRCRQLPGQALFQYADGDGTHQQIDSGMLNDYLREAMGEAFTAKDFRTWGGTSSAIAELAQTPLPETANQRAAVLSGTLKRVAAQLRNTPAVCRSSYVHPLVFDAWADGSLHRLVQLPLPRSESARERAALTFLRRRLRQAAPRRVVKRRVS